MIIRTCGLTLRPRAVDPLRSPPLNPAVGQNGPIDRVHLLSRQKKLDKYTPLAYTLPSHGCMSANMVIVETSIFTRQVRALLADEEYRELQTAFQLAATGISHSWERRPAQDALGCAGYR